MSKDGAVVPLPLKSRLLIKGGFGVHVHACCFLLLAVRTASHHAAALQYKGSIKST